MLEFIKEDDTGEWLVKEYFLEVETGTESNEIRIEGGPEIEDAVDNTCANPETDYSGSYNESTCCNNEDFDEIQY